MGRRIDGLARRRPEADSLEGVLPVDIATALSEGEGRQMVGKQLARVLVVDDDPGSQAVVAFLLREEGYDVTTAHDGSEALAALERELPDLVVLDLKMQPMDGAVFAAELERRGLRPRLPILVLSGA